MSECEEREDSCSVQETEREKTGSHTHQGTPLLSGGIYMSCHLPLLNRCVVQVSESGGKGQRSFQQATPTIFFISSQPYILYWYILFRDNVNHPFSPLSLSLSPSDLPSEDLSDDYDDELEEFKK